MAEPFLSELRMFGFNFAPKGWAPCDGQVMAINQNQALYSLLGIMFGGNGTTTFNLPDLRGRTPMHFSASYGEGQPGGQENVTLTTQQIPAHTHTLESLAGLASVNTPGNMVLAQLPADKTNYTPAANLTAMNAGSITPTGTSQGHPNVQPSLVINFCIALQGIYPTRD
ncbi:MAG: tail fiber protein [Acidobacteria bacterium]|nr:tail fiber protein [Acidobacteriota bacterium]